MEDATKREIATAEADKERTLLPPWPKQSISPLGWVSIGLRRIPFATMRVELTLLELVLGALFLGVHAGYIYYSYVRSPDSTSFAKSMGEVLHWDLALSLLFVTRNSIWQALLSCSFERSITYHRWISNTAILVGFVHGVTFYTIWLQESREEWIEEALEDTDNLFGQLALACYVLLFVFSLPFVRRKLFELFRWAHFILVPLFIGGILLHHGGGGFLLKASVSILFYAIDLGYRLYSLLLSPKSSATIVSANKVSNDIVKLTLKVDGFKYSAGQYVFLTLPQVAWFQAHPFSISSSPSDTHDGHFTVHIRSAGDYTFRLLRAVEMRPAELTKARVEGPYGALSINPYAYRRVVLIAGGIGITPMLSIMRQMASRMPEVDKVTLHWTIPQLSLYHAFSQDLVANDGLFETHVYVTRPSLDGTEQGLATFSAGVTLHQEGGRPSLEHVLADEAEAGWGGRVAVLVCGPEAMRSEVLLACSRHHTLDLHAETFEL